MENIQKLFSFNLWPLLQLLVEGVLLFIVLQIAERIIDAFAGKSARLRAISSNWTLPKRILWGLFLLLSIAVLIRVNPIAGGAISLLLIASFWSILRNFFVGIALNFDNRYRVGKSIRYEGFEGRILALGNLGCQLKLYGTSSEIMYIPYSRLSESLVIQTSPTVNTKKQVSEVTVPKPITVFDAEQLLRESLYNTPWLIVEEKHQMEHLGESGESHRFKVVLQATDSRHLKLAEKQLKDSLHSSVN